MLNNGNFFILFVLLFIFSADLSIQSKRYDELLCAGTSFGKDVAIFSGNG